MHVVLPFRNKGIVAVSAHPFRRFGVHTRGSVSPPIFAILCLVTVTLALRTVQQSLNVKAEIVAVAATTPAAQAIAIGIPPPRFSKQQQEQSRTRQQTQQQTQTLPRNYYYHNVSINGTTRGNNEISTKNSSRKDSHGNSNTNSNSKKKQQLSNQKAAKNGSITQQSNSQLLASNLNHKRISVATNKESKEEHGLNDLRSYRLHPHTLSTSNSLMTKIKRANKFTVHYPPYNGTLRRIFPQYGTIPCIPGPFGQYDYNTDRGEYKDRQGIFYAKLSKCSSSTLAGIAVQMARHAAVRDRHRHRLLSECMVKANHGRYKAVVRKRDRARSVLWTFVREPVARQLSDFFHFHVSRRSVPARDFATFEAASRQALSMVNTLAGQGHDGEGWGKFMTTSEQRVEYIMNAYDFIGTVERHHESLILLKEIFQLELRDILYTSPVKQSGGYDDGEYKNTCVYIQPTVASPEMKTWFQNSSAWRTRSRDDVLLYRVVNASLDMTIQHFGREHIQRQVETLHRALAYAQEVCSPSAVYPCSANGTKRTVHQTTCVKHDWACSHKCIYGLNLTAFQ